MNLIEGLQCEIKRVKEIIKEYDELPCGSGTFASTMMKGSIKQAENAIANMDTLAMLSAIKNLKEYAL